MKILHSSDWHIGRHLHQVSLLPDQREVLWQLVDTVEQHQVDVVLVAGDVYDRAVPPAAAVSLVDELLNRLCNELGVPVIMIAGNHDSPERLGFAARQLAKGNLYVVGPLTEEITPVTLKDTFGEVDFYPIPYADPATVRNLFPEVDAAELVTHDQCMAKIISRIHAQQSQSSSKRSVALSHCFVVGGASSESERPLSVGGAEQVSADHFQNFNYTALGHLHGPQQCTAPNIRYCGSILKYSFSEASHHKSMSLIEMDADGHCTIETIAFRPQHDSRVIEGALADILAQAPDDPNQDDYVLVRLSDQHAILDPIGKLRDVYPNVLHLERPGLIPADSQTAAHRASLKKDELSMFKDFYSQMQDVPLSDEQEQILIGMLDELHQQRRD